MKCVLFNRKIFGTMNEAGLIAWVFLLIPGVVLGNHEPNTTAGNIWDNVYEEYVCETKDGYLWLAEACTFPVRKALDYLLKYGDDTVDLYDSSDYTFNDIPLTQFDNENETIDTYLYDYNSIFPYSQDKICTEYMDLASNCMTHYFSSCSNNLNEDVDTYMRRYKNQYCDGSNLHEYIKDQKGVLEQFLTGNTRRATCSGLNDLYDDMVEQHICTEDLVFDSPYAIDRQNITEYTALNGTESFYDVQEEYSRKLLSAFRCMEVQMRDIGCPTSEAQSLVLFMYNYMVPPGLDVDLEQVAAIFGRAEEAESLTTGNEADRERVTCGFYNQGHLLRYGRLDNEDRDVCTFGRRWQTLLHNKFVKIDVYTTLQTATDFGAIYISSVEVVLLDGSGTTLIEYSTSGGDLSTDVTVVDDKTEVVYGNSGSSISLNEVNSDVLIISNPLGDVAITITRYDLMYGVWVRMYDEDFDRSYGVLVDGCDEIDPASVIGFTIGGGALGRRRRRDISNACLEECSQINDPYYEYNCLFDCGVNGGDYDEAVGSSRLAQKAQEKYAKTADSKLVDDYSSAPALHHPVVMATMSLAAFVFLLS